MRHRLREKLLRIVHDESENNQTNRQQDIENLFRAGGDSFQSVLNLIHSTEKEIALTACWVAGLLDDKRAIDPLLEIAMTEDADTDLRRVAIGSLGFLRNKKVISTLIAIMQKDADTGIRRAAAYSLGWYSGKNAAQALIHTMENQSEDISVRARATEALGILGETVAVLPLINALQSTIPEIRFWAAYSLGQLRDPRALPYLEHLSETDNTVIPEWWSISKEAVDAIKRIRVWQNIELQAESGTEN